jgi:putative DNA primase/helicase
MPAIADSPSRLEADRSIEILQGLLAEFPFADEASRSVALSMILTTVLRGALLPAVPMHVATAPQPGTGKSFLGDIASAVSTGERCAVIAIAPNPEETEKRLVGAALAGQQIIAIDNVSEMLSGDFLNQVTERPLLQLRPLGTSTIMRIANSFTVFANGNNLSAPADLVRRTLVCRLDANLENPEERIFESNPVKAVLDNRGLYIGACLTIGRAYISAGSPNPCRPLPSFQRWSDLVRSALVWLGMPDPCSSMEMARSEDPIRAARAAIFQAWGFELPCGKPGMTTAELVEETENRDEHGFRRPLFREACLNVAAERSGATVSSRRLGKWLSASNNNRVGNLKLTVDRTDPTRLRWLMTKE